VKGVCVKGGKTGDTGKVPDCTLETVYFGFNEYTLSDATKATLEKNQQCMSQTTLDVKVLGTTDPRGPDEYNIGLSDDRAQSVITYLMRLGVEGTRLHKVPLGKGEATGTDEDGWSKDRKVRFEWVQ
jgi:peptidoglycan-associated lipoprotein